MNYCVNCLRYDYCSAQRMCINPPHGYCTQYQPKRQKKCDACYADTAEWYEIPYNYHNDVHKYNSNLILCKECFEHLLDAVRERREDGRLY